MRPEPVPAASGSGEIPEIGPTRWSARITINRLIEGIGPTIGIPGVYCKKCEDNIGKHSQGCRDRFNNEYKKAAEADAEAPAGDPERAAQPASVPGGEGGRKRRGP